MELEMVRQIKFNLLKEKARMDTESAISDADDQVMSDMMKRFLDSDVMSNFIIENLLNYSKDNKTHAKLCEERIYNKVLESLQGNQRWTQDHNEQYLNMSDKIWKQQYQVVQQETNQRLIGIIDEYEKLGIKVKNGQKDKEEQSKK